MAAGFEGGPTCFFDEQQPHYKPPQPGLEQTRLQPRAGQCLVFNHAITHNGGIVTAGRKYLLRSEIMYRRVPLPADDDGDDDAGIGTGTARGFGQPADSSKAFTGRMPQQQCARCGSSFTSRNALFRHLHAEPDHVVLGLSGAYAVSTTWSSDR